MCVVIGQHKITVALLVKDRTCEAASCVVYDKLHLAAFQDSFTPFLYFQKFNESFTFFSLSITKFLLELDTVMFLWEPNILFDGDQVNQCD